MELTTNTLNWAASPLKCAGIETDGNPFQKLDTRSSSEKYPPASGVILNEHQRKEVLQTCLSRRLKIPVRDYLCSILPGLANFPINRIAELTPSAWLARN